ncbi:PE-PPE domain-containing protein [Mycolicibacterium fortuitum]|uniref:PE-PPE domain-containing protein n=1 Tax=Mycolicibacterium fortuitum TaxID=1766 RepID=UPI0007EC4DCC|nr:PE-PPE domain-containing protein [Mycolicibacterium fortuitum]OBI55743.1 PE-PPE domain-containing protein [Mycolicibacterium fortuitum]OBK05664.1 PE-PPE domain-containing protein [Mycolicibacterium fortuitum]UBV16802.1 PE-PPE domain-containing protein [Mycolicibacterium fortuitum]
MSQPTSSRLPKAKAAATAAAVVATTAALTAGVASSAPEALAAHNRSVQAEVELTAASNPDVGKIPDIVGIYGVGPIFWTAQLLGITPENVIRTAGGLTGNTALAETVIGLLDLLDAISPIEAGVKGPMPDDVYNAVNGLTYTTDALAQLLGVRDGSVMDKIVDWLVGNAPILNQRRDIILSESLGGLTTSLAYRDMINAVQSDDPNWGVGVTGQWLIFVNNVSRPGGGLFALATPLTNLFGLNLTTPDAGSYTNPDKTKVLNTSILDITWAYNPLSDVPTTLNPLAWANSAAAGVFLTYLLPDEGNNIGNHVLPKLLTGIGDGIKVMVDPTGGQGTSLIPGLGKLLDGLGIKLLAFPGNATYITYDSGNLPLLEPFRMAPHLLNLIPGVDIPTPLTDSIEPALRKLVNMGYQDVDPNTLERTFNEAGEQAYFWHSPLTPTQQLAANQIVFDALIDGIQDNALNPDAWVAKLPGANLEPIVKNAVSVAVAKALSDALEAVQKGADPMFDAVEKGLAPVTHALDDMNAQMETAIDNMLKVNGSTANKKSGSQSINSLPSAGTQLKTLSVEASDTDTGAKPTPIKDALNDLGLEQDSSTDNAVSKSVTKLSESAKTKAKARHATDANNPLKKSVKETVAKVRQAAEDTADKVEKAGKDTAKKLDTTTDGAKAKVKESKKPAKKAPKHAAA